MASSLPPDRYLSPGEYLGYVQVDAAQLYSSPNDFLAERNGTNSLKLEALPFKITAQQVVYVRVQRVAGNSTIYSPTDFGFLFDSAAQVLTVWNATFLASDAGYVVCISAPPKATDSSVLSRESSSLRVQSESSPRENPKLYCIAPDQLVVDPVVAETPETQFSTVPEIPLDFDDEDD